MVEISLSGSGEGPGWVTAPGYSTAEFSAMSDKSHSVKLILNRGAGERCSPAPAQRSCAAKLPHVGTVYGG
jgi:hypothetical protein